MRHIIRCLTALLILLMLGYCYTALQYDSIMEQSKDKYLLSTFSSGSYELDSTNTIYVNLSGFSNCISVAKEDGFNVVEEDMGLDYIDIIMVNDSTKETYRYYYTYPDMKLICFSSEYEDSYKCLTYIY